jgi:ABC-type antimicrobial peptide transport system permease subunit
MLSNYLKIAWRTILLHKGYAAINLLGLALGMTCCLFILLWVRDERSIDNFHADEDNLFTVFETFTANGKTDGDYNTPVRASQGSRYPNFLLDGAKEAIPEISGFTYYTTGYDLPWGYAETIRYGDKLVKLNGSRAGEDFFRMFSYPLLAGTPATALQNTSDIALSRKAAIIFFGSPAAAMGKTIRFENHLDFVVSAVFEDLPQQSSLKFDFLVNFELHKKGLVNWSSGNFQTFIRLSPGANAAAVTAKLNQMLQTRLGNNDGVKIRFGLQRYGDRYLHSTFINGQPATGRIEYVRIFSGVAVFILLIACINFMNLATARSVRRAKEVGLRKVVGSTRGYLIGQFLGESLTFALLAMVLSLMLLLIFLPAFNQFTSKTISFPFSELSFWGGIAGILLLTGLVAGSYPALYLSSLRPVSVLKGIFRFTRGAVLVRKSLTVFQFVLSIVLMIATIVIIRQTDYVQNTNLGYNRENLVYIRVEGDLSNMDKYERFKQEALTMPGIAMVDRSSETPHAMNFVANPDAMNWEGKGKDERVGFKPASVGFDFVKLMDLRIVEGRDFSPQNPTDSTEGFLVNEEAVRQMGMQHPLGKWISAWSKKGHIIGVLKDFHTQSFREPILPVIVDVKEWQDFGVILIRTKPGQTKEAIASLTKVYKDVNPDYAFAWEFVDEQYKQLYSSEMLISRLSVLFASVAIAISCLGLLGLVMFSAEQRTKEIGIRKVLGASISQILTIFSMDFLRLIALAFLIAGPLAWAAMNTWLSDFAYRITISWWIFALAGSVAFLIAMLTVCYQAIRAANANPLSCLRSE